MNWLLTIWNREVLKITEPFSESSLYNKQIGIIVENYRCTIYKLTFYLQYIVAVFERQ